MAQTRRGLGRGLSALLEETRPLARGDHPDGDVRLLPIELVRANPSQPRRHFDAAALAELSASIASRGILQPILVRPAPDAAGEFQIVAGERRWRAAQMARLHAVPAIVRMIGDDEVGILALIENLQRADLNPLEEARAYGELLDRLGGDTAAVAKAVGKSCPHVANTLRLLRLPAEVRTKLEEGALSAGHARAIAGAEDPTRLAEEVLRRGMSVRQAEALARRAGARVHRPRSGERDPDIAALERGLAEAIGLEVSVRDRGGAGEVRVRYRSLEQLDDICGRLSRA